MTQHWQMISHSSCQKFSLEAARVGVHNLAHSVMAVGWVDAETVALAAYVGQAA